ncbi:MAG: ATP-binding cassette domain-containing protein [Propionibacteriales bacterium]|nr:ATP-binding cassette domain-containing protein [Propionibacteriales bacterium]
MRPLLRVSDLTVEFPTREGVIRPADGVTWELEEGRTLVILGESGSGKSVSTQAVGGILPYPGRVVGGRVEYKGEDLLTNRRLRQRLRGKEIAMVFQDPLSSLNPGLRVGGHIVEMFKVHGNISRAEAWQRAVELLDLVQIPDPEDRVQRYPHELSGGMRQRVMLAIAVSQQPSILIADEPTTALDATVQAQIIDTVRDLQRNLGTAIVLITHDIGVAAAFADDIAVMYGGRVVERGSATDVLRRPRHPYTEALLSSVPHVEGRRELAPIPGAPPRLHELPSGCAFHPRCQYAKESCTRQVPELRPLAGGGRLVACDLSEQLYAGVETAESAGGEHT